MHQLHKTLFIHQLHKVSFIHCFFLIFLFFQKEFHYSSFSIHQLHKVSFIHCFCFVFVFFSDKISILFSMHHLHKVSFIHQLHEVSFINYFCFIRQNLHIYPIYKWEESLKTELIIYMMTWLISKILIQTCSN